MMEIDDEEDDPPRKTLALKVSHILERADRSDDDDILPHWENRDDDEGGEDLDDAEEPEESDEAELGASFYNFTKIACLPECRETLEGLDFTCVHFLQAYPNH
jgi:hypothetical protein